MTMRKKQRSKRENLKLKTSEPKLRYRMYKSKKRWLYATISSISILGGGAAGTDLTALASVKDTNASKTNFKLPALKALESDERGKANSVAVDPDSNRPDFENILTDNANNIKSPTSVNVATPEQVINDAQYKAQAQADGTYAAVSTFAELVSAWNNNSIRYIDITANFEASNDGASYDTANLFNQRTVGSDVIVQGNGHTVNLKDNMFRFVSTASATSVTTVTLSNASFIHTLSTNGPESNALVTTTDGRYLTTNIDNVILSSQDHANNKWGNTAVYSPYGKAVFSGKNSFSILRQVTNAVTKIEVSNDASVENNRPNSSWLDSVFDFDRRNLVSSTVGYGNSFSIGDGTTIAARAESNNITTPIINGAIDQITAGDNVTWAQEGWQYFIHGGNGAKADAQYIFGQNFNLTLSKSKAPYSLFYIYQNQSVQVNAGAVIDANQWNSSGPLINVNSSNSKVEFISPKSLHLNLLNANGTPAAGGLYEVTARSL